MAIENFFKYSNYEVGTFDGVRISVKQPKVLHYSEGELQLSFHSEVDLYLHLHFETHVYIPEEISWTTGQAITKDKRDKIISNIIQGLHLLGSGAVIHPDGRTGMRETSFSENEIELTQDERFGEKIDRQGRSRKTRDLFYPFIPTNASVYASGINLEAYRAPGDYSALLEKGLVPYESTTRFKEIWDQVVEAHPEFSYYERSSIYMLDVREIYFGAVGDVRFYPGPFGLGDYKFIRPFSRFLVNRDSKELKSVNGKPTEMLLKTIDKLTKDLSVLSSSDIKTLVALFSHGLEREVSDV